MNLVRALLALLIVGAITPVFAADWSQPATLDIYDPAILELLDTDVDAIINTAWEAYGDGDYEKAAQYYLAVLHVNSADEGTMYNLACCYGLLGEPELAADFVKRAYTAGFEDVWHIENDTDFDAVRDSEVFQAGLAEIKADFEEKETARGNVVFFKEPVFLRGRVYLPPEYDPHEQYPLVVGLHGFGSQPDRYVGLWKRFETVDFIYVVPQAPYPFMSDIDTVGYSWGYGTATGGLPVRSWEMSQDYIANVIEQMRSLYQISDVFLLGFSQGAGIALSTGIANRNQVTGIIAFGGWLEEEWLTAAQLEHGKSVRVFLAHGNEDAIVEFSNSQDAYDKLLGLEYDVTLHEFDGGHSVPEDVIHLVEEWMRAEPEPAVNSENQAEEEE